MANIIIQTSQAFKFTRPATKEELDKDVTNRTYELSKRMADSVTVKPGRPTSVPEWIKEDWIFHAAVADGLLIEIVSPDKVAATVVVPTSSNPLSAKPVFTPQPKAPWSKDNSETQ